MTPEQIRDEILKLIFEYMKKGDHFVQDKHIAEAANLDIEDIRYHLRYLNRAKYIKILETINGDMMAELTIAGEARVREGYSHPQPGTHFNISNSTIGSINSGIIRELQVNIGALQNSGKESLSKSLQQMIDAIAQTNQLAEDSKAEVLEQLSFLAEQMTQPPTGRKLSVARLALNTIPALIGHAADLVGLWESQLAQQIQNVLEMR